MSRNQKFQPVHYNLWFFNKSKENIQQFDEKHDENFKFQFNEEIQNPKHQLVLPGKEKLVGWWLLLTCAGVFFMITLGGYTRLSNSGLSMVKWKPIDLALPQNDDKWQEEFEHYKQYPEYQEQFKRIFFVEWFHRFVGSCLGGIFMVPFAFFYFKGYLKPKMTKRLLFLLALGGTQGLIGWWMVKSGLKERPEYQTRPRVSVYRLCVHLNTALVIYGTLLWNSLTLLRKPQELLLKPSYMKSNKRMRFLAIMLCHFLALNTFSGSIAAGIDAMKVFNDWPFFNGELVPQKVKDLQISLKDIFEDRSLANFNHRNFGYLTLTWTLFLFIRSQKLRLLPMQKFTVSLASSFIYIQAINGILTLSHNCPKEEAQIHQLLAICTLTSVLLMTHTFRPPSSLYRQFVQKSIAGPKPL